MNAGDMHSQLYYKEYRACGTYLVGDRRGWKQ
jgi:hypothetical protein